MKKKTDLQRMEQLFESLGLEPMKTRDGSNTILRLESGQSKCGGYSFFYADFTFDKNGTFIGVGIWE